MIKDILLINQHSQIRELGSEIKYNILRELIKNPATCKQLADLYGISKQKVHYNLNKLLDQNLIEISPEDQNNSKEVYYRATAKNFVLDFSVGQNINDNYLNNREIIDRILTQEYKVNLLEIASKLLDESLKMKTGEKLLIVTGKYNLPLVEKILIEASRRSVSSTLIYQDQGLLKAKYEEFSLAAFAADYKNFNELLGRHDVYLNLNGEARYVEITDPQKLRLRAKFFAQSRRIISQKKIRVAIMPGLLHDTLTEFAIESELQFWKALNIDYNRLCERTTSMCRDLSTREYVRVANSHTGFTFAVEKALAECGSFGGGEFQSPVINLPGGEVLLIPKPGTLNGTISADVAYIGGERVTNPVIKIRDNAIVDHNAAENPDLIDEAVRKGGEDGAKVALICLGTNENVNLANIDSSYKHKSRGLLTLYWGENRSLGGDVQGNFEWFIQIERPQISFVNKGEEYA